MVAGPPARAAVVVVVTRPAREITDLRAKAVVAVADENTARGHKTILTGGEPKNA